MDNSYTFSEYPILKEINQEAAKKIYILLQQREISKATQIYAELSDREYEDAANLIDDLETEMIRKNEIPNLPRYYKVFLICGICKDTKPMGKGYIFHFTDDWLHIRLFICQRCISQVAVQQTLHEVCGECIADLPKSMLFDSTKSSFKTLARAIKDFEITHSPIFDKLPASTDDQFCYPGSGNVDFNSWLKEHDKS